ncbi:hypothetical protein [Oceanobacillus rekensis]|uniref:hypothetical protein n=1 Tax=Oceanobacillus rekensis TaxID=937927 RepID=UPI000B4308AC|nr:hypothetical protein [Oceanobacillus rekensis]
MIKSILKFWVPWVIVVILVAFAKSLLLGEVVDWDTTVTLIITGLIGFLTISGIKKAIKKAEE